MKTPEVERAAGRRRLAKKGHALKDGSFPIPDVAHLRKAIKLAGNGKNPAAARALCIRRAKALGRMDLIPDSWRGSKKKKVTTTSTPRPATVILLARRKHDHSSRIHPGLDRSPKANWVEKAGGLPNYIERIAKHIHYDSGLSISHAIAAAVNRCKVLCAKGNAQACAAVASWERKRAGTRIAATDIRGRKLTDLEFAEIIERKILLAGRGVGASGSNRPFDASKYLRDPTTGKFSSKFTPAEMIAGHRIVEAGVVNLQVGQVFKLPNNAGWVQRSEGGYLVQGPAGIRVAVRTASEAVQAAANIMIGQLRRVGEPKK